MGHFACGVAIDDIIGRVDKKAIATIIRE